MVGLNHHTRRNHPGGHVPACRRRDGPSSANAAHEALHEPNTPEDDGSVEEPADADPDTVWVWAVQVREGDGGLAGPRVRKRELPLDSGHDHVRSVLFPTYSNGVDCLPDCKGTYDHWATPLVALTASFIQRLAS